MLGECCEAVMFAAEFSGCLVNCEGRCEEVWVPSSSRAVQSQRLCSNAGGWGRVGLVPCGWLLWDQASGLEDYYRLTRWEGTESYHERQMTLWCEE